MMKTSTSEAGDGLEAAALEHPRQHPVRKENNRHYEERLLDALERIATNDDRYDDRSLFASAS